MRLRFLLHSLLAAVLSLSMLIAAPLTANAAPCPPTISPAPATPSAPFDPNNWILGPKDLPTASPVGAMVVGYDRFNGMTKEAWLAEFFPNSEPKYPDNHGFAGQPVKKELTEGTLVDRFGNPGGGYVAIPHTPYAQRALPPANLTTNEGNPVANYHVYCVTKPFSVDSGTIAPGFNQSGGGTQYYLNVAYIPGYPNIKDLSVTFLIENGYLTEVHPQ